MTTLARKVLICAAVDGLILHPLTKKDTKQPTPIQIRYGDASISRLSSSSSLLSKDLPPTDTSTTSFEAFGIIGLVTVSRFSYLVSITRRQQVAVIRGYPVYVVTGVALTPCSSYGDARESVGRTAAQLDAQSRLVGSGSGSGDGDGETAGNETDDEGYESEAGEGGGSRRSSVSAGDVEEHTPSNDGDAENGGVVKKSAGSRSSVINDVVNSKGSYGRFAQSWFSKSGWMQDQKRTLGLSHSQGASNDKDEENEESPALKPHPGQSQDAAAASKAAGVAVTDATEQEMAPPALLPKLLKTSQVLFGTSRAFYFSYDVDITRNLANSGLKQSPGKSLYEQVDPMFFWNRNIIKPLIDQGVDSLVLPCLQGFIGQKTFTVDSRPPQKDDVKGSVELSEFSSGGSARVNPDENSEAEKKASEKQFDITVISRRSIHRAGLRYLRRGIDEEGFVANSVETEQILTPHDSGSGTKTYSFVQVRGSIPVFFTQSPYSLKPTPVFKHSDDANYEALRKHFSGLQKRYGDVQIANLVEKHGVEAPIGEKYETGVARLNAEHKDQSQVGFEWFDFHTACRGMKFENVQQLIGTLSDKLGGYGSTIEDSSGVKSKQTGVIRTNCMDCLDRTNVCQSSFAKYMLDAQLKEQGYDMTLQKDQVNSWFNNLWADNGDAISKQYASTAAMKGDYTRTRQRNYRGALADAGLGLTRFFSGMVNDFFLQATIDFLLGNVTSLVFDEFETTMMTQDPAVSLTKMREQAIEQCQKRVIADDKEDINGAWVLLGPATSDSLTASPFQEVIFILTDIALYLCRYDWSLDKVSSFERVELSHVKGIKSGVYITSTLSAAQTDENKNIGFVVTYEPGEDDVQRTNTRSISNLETRAADVQESGGVTAAASALTGLLGRRVVSTVAPSLEQKRMAFKAPYAQSSMANANNNGDSKVSEKQLVATICADIDRLALKSRPRRENDTAAAVGEEQASLIEDGEIISLAEAKRNVGLLDGISHSLKKLVWA